VLAAFALWLFTLLLVTPLAIDSSQSFRPSFGFIRFIIFGAALGYWVLSENSNRKAFEYGVILLVAFIIIDTCIQYFVGADLFGRVSHSPTRLTGPFKDLVPGTLVLRIVFIGIAAFYCSKRIQSVKTKVLVMLVLMAGIAGFFFLTGERGAFLNYLLGCTLLLTGIIFIYPYLRLWVLGGAITMMSGIAVLAMTNPTMRERTITSSYHYIADWPQSVSGRIVIPALKIWSRNNLLTGIGLRNYRTECPKPEYADIEPKFCVNHPHNIYVEWLVEAGIIGLVGFTFMVVLIVREFLQSTLPSKQHMILLFALAVFLTTFWPLQGSGSYFTNRWGVVIWMTVGWALAFTSQDAKQNK
jgi:O-antigen ligase